VIFCTDVSLLYITQHVSNWLFRYPAAVNCRYQARSHCVWGSVRDSVWGEWALRSHTPPTWDNVNKRADYRTRVLVVKAMET